MHSILSFAIWSYASSHGWIHGERHVSQIYNLSSCAHFSLCANQSASIIDET